ncbi:MAG: flagellar biosynthetic protein FliR [Myxococcales bacterium]|nr:flagellar biosynthetic protein FliR [Myxococcales bacterium]
MGVELVALFAFLRVGAFFISSPFPGILAPPSIRLIASAGIAWGFSDGLSISNVQNIWLVIISETLLGLAMGFFLSMIMYSFAYAGELVSQQMGLRMPGFVSPVAGDLSLLGSAMSLLMLGFFAVGTGPHMLMLFLYRMFEVIPIGAWEMPNRLGTVVEVGVELFSGALQIGAPLISAVFAAQLVLAILARSVPTLNLFIEGPALTTSSGIVGLIATAGAYGPLTLKLVSKRFEQIAFWLSG